MKKILNTLYVLTPESYLSLDGENVVVSKDNHEAARLPLHTIQEIVLFTYKGISPALMGKCVEHCIGISFMRPNGRFLANVTGNPNGNVLLRRQQYRIADNGDQSVKYAISFITAKIFNARWVLERTMRDHPDANKDSLISNASSMLKSDYEKMSNVTSLEELRGLEGDAARTYFSVFDLLIIQQKDKFKFDGRNRRPPMDPVNAMLSFAYSLLANEVSSALSSVGLDPYVGFMHVDRPGRKSLALDLEEELRAPFADRFVLTGINLKKFGCDMFTYQESGAVLLNDDGRKLFITEWQKRKQEVITHPFLKEKMQWGMVPRIQAQLLARSIRDEGLEYPPFLWK